MPSPAETVRALLTAYEHKDRAAAEALIGDDLIFTSPADNRIDRKTYFERCWPNSEAIESSEIVRLIEDGEQVVMTYIGRNKGGHAGQNTDCYRVRNGKIVEIEVYFGWDVPHEAKPGGWVKS